MVVLHDGRCSKRRYGCWFLAGIAQSVIRQDDIAAIVGKIADMLKRLR
jgi:hypothetical protein